MNKAFFHLNRGGPIVEVLFDEIKEIRVNGYLIFNIKGQKIYYHNAQNRTLLNTISKISSIKWGNMCKIWGPSKKDRDDINRIIPILKQ